MTTDSHTQYPRKTSNCWGTGGCWNSSSHTGSDHHWGTQLLLTLAFHSSQTISACSSLAWWKQSMECRSVSTACLTLSQVVWSQQLQYFPIKYCYHCGQPSATQYTPNHLFYSTSHTNAFITSKFSDQTEQRKNNEENKKIAKTGFSLMETISETTHLLREPHSSCLWCTGSTFKFYWYQYLFHVNGITVNVQREFLIL